MTIHGKQKRQNTADTGNVIEKYKDLMKVCHPLKYATSSTNPLLLSHLVPDTVQANCTFCIPFNSTA